MAGAGYKLFNTGDVLTAAQVNTYLQEQAVMRFASAAARTTALSGVLAEGMVSYLMDTNAVEVYDGSAWVGVATGDITAVTAGTGISGGGTSGAVTITNSMATEITAAGDIIVGTGSGAFDNLPIGTTGQVLTADTTVSPYKVKWATASGGDWVKVATASPSAVGSISINSCFSSTYKAYKIIFVLTASAGTNLLWKGRVGSTDTSSNYNYQDFELSNTTFYNASYTGQSSGKCGDLQTYLTTNEMTITDPYATASTAAVSLSSSSGANLKINSSRQTDSTSFDGITFLTGSGTMSGNIYVYGMKA